MSVGPWMQLQLHPLHVLQKEVKSRRWKNGWRSIADFVWTARHTFVGLDFVHGTSGWWTEWVGARFGSEGGLVGDDGVGEFQGWCWELRCCCYSNDCSDHGFGSGFDSCLAQRNQEKGQLYPLGCYYFGRGEGRTPREVVVVG